MGADRAGFPARGEESHHRHEGKKEQKDRECLSEEFLNHMNHL
jgi:hypothetical protein